MSDWKTITKEQFDIAYDNHMPSGWIKFAYKYFSKETEMKDLAVKKTVVGVLITLFVLGFVGTVLNLSAKLIAVFGVSYGILLAALVLYLFSAVILNNIRISEIRKELGVTAEEYNALVSKFYS